MEEKELGGRRGKGGGKGPAGEFGQFYPLLPQIRPFEAV